jgi:aminopeptidase N
VIGRLGEVDERVDGIRIRVWWHTPRGRQRLLTDAASAVRTLTRDAGPYRAHELDVVESDFHGFGGMEYPELVMTEIAPEATVHEVAHQWWFGMVGDDEYAEPWLDESFASYSEHLILGTIPSPCDVGDPLAAWTTPLDTSVAYFRRHVRRYGEVYTGGACVLYAYERAAGTAAVFALLHLLLRRFGGGVETTDDVIQSMRQTAPPRFDLDEFLARSRIR